MTGPKTPPEICWVNFVQLQGTRYVDMGQYGRVLEDADLGPAIGTVAFKLDGNVHDPDYQARHGDAGLLEPGTTIHEVHGYAPWFRVAARADGRIYLFEADRNLAARYGADLLDLSGKVDSIQVLHGEMAEGLLAAVTDPAEVAELVGMVLGAPVDFDERPALRDEDRVTLAFVLEDGTAVVRRYWPGAGFMQPALRPAGAFAARIAEVRERHSGGGAGVGVVQPAAVCTLD